MSATYQSGSATIRVDQYEPADAKPHAALVLLHGSGGAAAYWLDRFAPLLNQFGVAVYAPHYFDRTGTKHASAETILDGKHFGEWLAAVKDAVTYATTRPSVDANRIGVLGISLGGYLAMALAAEDRRVRAVIELSGGMPPGWESRIAAGMAPVLVLHGAQDEVVPVSEADKLRALLQERGVEHEVEILANEGHWFSPASRPGVLMRCAAFLAKYLR